MSEEEYQLSENVEEEKPVESEDDVEEEFFSCRVCGHNTYLKVGRFCVCGSCSTLFLNPCQFSIQKIEVIKLDERAIIPTKNYESDTGYDLYSIENKTLNPGDYKVIKTGITIKFPKNIAAQVRPRSGLAAKQGFSIVNSPGTIDETYRNDIGVILINLSNNTYEVKEGDRIAQLVFEPVLKTSLIEYNEENSDNSDKEEDNTKESRNLDGFGSSGY